MQIPLIVPIITFFLGLIAIPITESLKSYLEKKRLMVSLLVELQDEIYIIDREFQFLIECYVNIKKINNGVVVDKFLWITPGKLKIYSIDKLLENHFEKLPSDLRKSVKNIKEYLEHLEDISENLSKYRHNAIDIISYDPNISKLILTMQYSYLSAILTHRYNISYLINILLNKENSMKMYSDIGFDECIRHQLKTMNKEEYIQLFFGESS